MKLTITRPDDWHLHLRDGDMLKAVASESARDFARAIIMPNLVPPVVRGDDAKAYRERILVKAVKLYPAGATTNSASGVTNFKAVMPVLERMAKIGLPLCTHGEVVDSEVDIFDREAVFIERVLTPIRKNIPDLKVVMEHITTKDGVDYIGETEKNLAGTITTHHLIINRNHILAGGIKPHYYCLPVAKRELHRQALRRAATSGDKRYFLGTDSAPHIDPAVPGVLPRPIRCPALLTCLRKKGPWTGLRLLPASMDPPTTGCRSTRAR